MYRGMTHMTKKEALAYLAANPGSTVARETAVSRQGSLRNPRGMPVATLSVNTTLALISELQWKSQGVWGARA